MAAHSSGTRHAETKNVVSQEVTAPSKEKPHTGCLASGVATLPGGRPRKIGHARRLTRGHQHKCPPDRARKDGTMGAADNLPLGARTAIMSRRHTLNALVLLTVTAGAAIGADRPAERDPARPVRVLLVAGAPTREYQFL